MADKFETMGYSGEYETEEEDKDKPGCSRLSIHFNVEAALNGDRPNELNAVLSIKDELWGHFVDNPEPMVVICMEALVSAIRCVAKPGENLFDHVDRAARLMKARIGAMDDCLITVVPTSYIEGYGSEVVH